MASDALGHLGFWAQITNSTWAHVSCLLQNVIVIHAPAWGHYPITGKQMQKGQCSDAHLPISSNEGYAYAKRMVEVLSRCYNEQHSRNYITVVPTNVFGPFDNFK